MNKVQTINSLDELDNFAKQFVAKLKAHRNRATIVALEGDLGSGKTAFVKCCAKILGIEQLITSPTFVIQKEYNLDDTNLYNRLIHIDAYRLRDISELEYLGWSKLCLDSKNIIIMEWPNAVCGLKLSYDFHIAFEVCKNESRKITLKSG